MFVQSLSGTTNPVFIMQINQQHSMTITFNGTEVDDFKELVHLAYQMSEDNSDIEVLAFNLLNKLEDQ